MYPDVVSWTSGTPRPVALSTHSMRNGASAAAAVGLAAALASSSASASGAAAGRVPRASMSHRAELYSQA